MNIKSTTRSALLPPAKYGLMLFLLISILFVSTGTKAQHPAIVWEQLGQSDEEMVDVISAGGKVFSIGNERHSSAELHFCDDFTYNRPTDYEGMWGARYRYNTSGIEESRSPFVPPVGTATGAAPSEAVRLSNPDGVIPIANHVLWTPTTAPVRTGRLCSRTIATWTDGRF